MFATLVLSKHQIKWMWCECFNNSTQAMPKLSGVPIPTASWSNFFWSVGFRPKMGEFVSQAQQMAFPMQQKSVRAWFYYNDYATWFKTETLGLKQRKKETRQSPHYPTASATTFACACCLRLRNYMHAYFIIFWSFSPVGRDHLCRPRQAWRHRQP